MMEKNARPRGLRIAAALALALVCALGLTALSPTRALAAESVAHTYDGEGNRVDYASIHDAVAAGYGTDIVYLDKDIEITSAIDVAAGKTLKLDMQGHAIKMAKYNVRIFDVREGAKLTVVGSEERTFSYKGYDKSDTTSDMQVTSGGLLTGGMTVGSAGAINMREGSTVTLDHVAVAGNETANGSGTHSGGGGIYVGENCKLYLENNAIVTANYTNMNGGGILVGGENARVELNDSSVAHNFAYLSGGGIYVVRKGVSIGLRNNSHIDDNRSFSGGGGVYFFSSSFELTCNDATSTISKNYAVDGGGVCVGSAMTETNKGLIEGLEISDNSSFSNGGGLSVSQENITIKNCTISGNEISYGEGGGLYICNDDILLEGCTVTGNTAETEGGGVYVPYKYDLKVAGKLIVKDNARKDGAVDDVFLDSTSANNIWAYLRGNLDEGSNVGIRTGVTGDRRIMKDLTNYIEGTVFMDMDEYHLSYGSSDNDLWQRKGEYDYLVTLNGKNVRRFTRGDTVIIDGKSDDSGKFFWHWDGNTQTGLPDGISDEALYNSTLSFTMPQNDVHLTAVYASPMASASAKLIGSVEAGKALPSIALFTYETSEGTKPCNVGLTWYEVKEDGTKAPVSGKAKSGTRYVATFTVTRDASKARVFSNDFADDGVAVSVLNGSPTASAETTVDAATGALTVTTAEFTIEGDKSTEASGLITVNLKNAGVGGGEETISLAANADEEGGTEEDVFDSIAVTYAAGSDSVTISAPQAEGMNFCNWDDYPSDSILDNSAETIEIKSPTSGMQLTAVYTPVVTAADLGLDAPVAGKALPDTLTSLEVTCSDGSKVDFMDVFSDTGTLPVSWSPATDGDAALCSSVYTAFIELGDGDGLEDVEKVMSPEAYVMANGTQTTSAGFTVMDGKLYLCVTFPETQGAKLAEVTRPDDVELTFDEAKAYQAKQDVAAEGDLCWPLPKSCAIKLEGGQTIACDVTWDVPAGFDANATAAQELVATGTLSLPSHIDGNGVSLDVTCTIKVTSPDGGDDKGDDEDDKGDDDEHGKEDEKGDGDEDATKPDSKDGEKKSLPQTGDTNSTATVVALGVAGVVIIAAALVLRGRKK